MADGRTTLIRDGVAAGALQGVMVAQTFVDTTVWRCAAPVSAIRRAPDGQAEQLDQLVFGEVFDVLLTDRAFAFGQARRDGYVGYVASADLAAGLVEPTHWVSVPSTLGFSKPDLKSAPVGLFTLNSLLRIEALDGRFGKAEGAGWLVMDHLSPIGQGAADAVTVAEEFRFAPYQWGGRERSGLDCSGLVQQALYALGRSSPRDTDQQAALGEPVKPESLRRGDLVFWKGHVAMMVDGKTMLHANAHHMATQAEPLAEAIARIRAAGGGEPTAYRRP